jgi:predicted transcriptional regulator
MGLERISRFTVIQTIEAQVAILRAIKERKTDTSKISEATGLSVELVKYYLMEMQKEGFLRCSNPMAVDGHRDYALCHLEPKGEVALENPDFLLKSNQVSRNQTNIYAKNVGFVNSGDGTVTNFLKTSGKARMKSVTLLARYGNPQKHFQKDSAKKSFYL